jgi:protein TonB
MNSENILKSSFLDILFEGKNKEYGAYELRKNYKNRLYVAILVTVCMSCLLLGFTMLPNKNSAPQPVYTEVILESVQDKPKEEKKEEKKVAKTTQPNSIKHTTPKIVPDKSIKDEVQEVDSLDLYKIGKIDVRDGVDTCIFGPIGDDTSTVEVTEPVKIVDENVIFESVQVQAQFPGGVSAWRRYLERNLRSELPLENGASAGYYTVTVSFIVDRNGNISEVVAENDPGFGTADEAIRVIKKGPKWEPAIQNGNNVTYRQKQKITFVVSE